MSDEEYLKVSSNDIFNNYKVIKSIGKGAFSKVYKVHDIMKDKVYALKIGRKSNRFQKSYKNEIELLEKLNSNNNPHIIRMIDNFKLNNRYFLVFEIYGDNLYNYLGKNNYKGLPVQKVKEFAYQIIIGLKLLENLNIIHGDLKPENILVSSSEKQIKIIDFGSSVYYKKDKIFNYIQTRYYRSPEVLIGLDITPKIDIWSLGCIIYEMLRGYPLFKALNYQDLFLYQAHQLGVPDKELINKSLYGDKYLTKQENIYKLINIYDSKNILYKPKTRNIERHITKENQEIFNILLKSIVWNPERRLNLEEF